jgi:polyhydroxyalkanoate synthesis repressor PhaR
MKPETQTVELRKYPNRRYYDATHSRHVTLEEIQTLIRDGLEVRVTDSASGEDITAKLLTQIILELDTPKLSIFPVPLLHRLIRANESLVRDFVDKYFNQALLAFLDSQRQFEQYLRHTLRLQTSQPLMTDWSRFLFSPFGIPPMPDRQDQGTGLPEPQSAVPGAEEPLQAEVEALKRQVAELQAALREKTNVVRKPRLKKG